VMMRGGGVLLAGARARNGFKQGVPNRFNMKHNNGLKS